MQVAASGLRFTMMTRLLALGTLLVLCAISVSADEGGAELATFKGPKYPPCGPKPHPRAGPDIVLAKVRTCRDLIFWYQVANRKANAWPKRAVVLKIHPWFCPSR